MYERLLVLIVVAVTDFLACAGAVAFWRTQTQKLAATESLPLPSQQPLFPRCLQQLARGSCTGADLMLRPWWNDGKSTWLRLALFQILQSESLVHMSMLFKASTVWQTFRLSSLDRFHLYL
jgi:hypothetical protein